MRCVKFFILSVLILSLSSLTISAKVISYCLDKKYSQLNETNHVHSNKSCHSQSNDAEDVCLNCECYYIQVNTFQVDDILDAQINNFLFNNLSFTFDSLNPLLRPPPPKLIS